MRVYQFRHGSIFFASMPKNYLTNILSFSLGFKLFLHFFEVRARFELAYQGFADPDLTYRTPNPLATVMICSLCRNLVIGFDVNLIT